MEYIIKVDNLKKSYKDLLAVDNISLQVAKGSLFAFLGPNGAGKSTTIDILSTLIQKDAGEITINNNILGKDDSKIRSTIGVVFQNGVLDDVLTIKENLLVRGSFYGLKGDVLNARISEAVNLTQCNEFLNQRYGKLSGGQKRRADIARALINKPEILFLDEPTTGLDPKTRLSVWNTIKDMQKQSDMTVFLTTHYMEEAAVADMIYVINHGKIVAKGSPKLLKDQYTQELLKIYSPSDKVVEYLKVNNIDYNLDKETIVIAITKPVIAIDILNALKQDITSFEMILGSMDDVFLNIIEESQKVIVWVS